MFHLIGGHERCRIHCFGSKTIRKEVRLDNLDITSLWGSQPHSFKINQSGKLILRHCTVRLNGCIKLEDDASLEITDCCLYGDTDSSDDAICISPLASQVTIARNTFKDFSHGVKILFGQNNTVNYSAKVQITDNVFENCSEHPIIQEMGQNDTEQRSSCCILTGDRRIVKDLDESENVNVVHGIQQSNSYDSESSFDSSSSSSSYNSL